MESTPKKSKRPQESVIKKLPEESGILSSASGMILVMPPDKYQDGPPPKSGKLCHMAKRFSKVSEDSKDTLTKRRVITKGSEDTPSESGVIFKRPRETSSESELTSKKSKDILPGSGDKTTEETQVSGESSKGPSDTEESVVLFKRPRDIPSGSKEVVTQKSAVSSEDVSGLVSPSGSGVRPKSVVVSPGTSSLKPRSVVVIPGGSGLKPKSVVVAAGTNLLKPRSVVVSPGGSGTKPKSVVVVPGIKRKSYVVTAGSASFPEASGSGVKTSGSDAKASGDLASVSEIQAVSSELEDSGLGLEDSENKRQPTDELYSPSEESEKILIVADVQGKFDKFFPKIKKIVKKIKGISFVMCIGDFFGGISQKKWQAYYEGSKKVPIDTYVLGPVDAKQVEYYPRSERHRNDKFIDLADKIFYLGKLGIFTTKTGLNIAFLSGMESKESTAYSYNYEDVNELVVMLSDRSNNYLPIDIFICNQWPTNISSDFPAENSSDLLQMVVKALVPRYVFSGTEGVWFKRNPYINEYPFDHVYTRFIGLGKFDSNQKAIFALELKKESETLQVNTLDKSPFINIMIYPGHVDFRWDASAMYEDSQNNDGSEVDPSHEDDDPPLEHEAGYLCPHMSNKGKNTDCWFCLSSSDFEHQYMFRCKHCITPVPFPLTAHYQ